MTEIKMEEMIRDTAEKVFTGISMPGESFVFDQELWDKATDAGFTAALASEVQGGLGLTAVEAFASVRVAAARAVALPLGETILVNWLLSLSGLPVEKGPCGVSLPATISQTVSVPFGRTLSALVVIEPEANGGTLALYRPVTGCWKLGNNIADEPRDFVVSDLGHPETVRTLPLSPDTVLSTMAMLRAVQSAAATASVLTMSLSYCNERVQFGRSLSKFQAIQHQLAQLAAEVSAATAAADIALAAFSQVFDEPDVFATQVAAAKVRTAEAATRAAAIAHQVHGAMGFSGEYALHPLTRRLWSWRDEEGSEAYWADRLGREIGKQAPKYVWPYLTSMDFVHRESQE